MHNVLKSTIQKRTSTFRTKVLRLKISDKRAEAIGKMTFAQNVEILGNLKELCVIALGSNDKAINSKSYNTQCESLLQFIKMIKMIVFLNAGVPMGAEQQRIQTADSAVDDTTVYLYQ